MKAASVFLVGMALALPAAAQQAGPPAAAIARTCYVCHGPEGRTDGPISSLAGVPRDNVLKQLIDFKGDRRPGTIMNRIAKSYSDDELKAVADYLAKLK